VGASAGKRNLSESKMEEHKQMELQITGKNIDISPSLRRYIERKLGKLNRHLPNITESKIEIIEQKTKSPQQRFVVQVTVDSNGILLHGEEKGQDPFTAIDKVAEVMNRQIEHYKGKLSRHHPTKR